MCIFFLTKVVFMWDDFFVNFTTKVALKSHDLCVILGNRGRVNVVRLLCNFKFNIIKMCAYGTNRTLQYYACLLHE